MHALQVNIGPVLVVSSPIVVQSSNLFSLGRCSVQGRTAGTVFVDVVTKVDNVVRILVDNGSRVSRKEAAAKGEQA